MHKGKVFTAADLAHKTRLDEPSRVRLAAEMTERYKIIAMDGDMPIIAEELDERILRKLSGTARPIATMLLGLSVEARKEVLNAFDCDDGMLICPFDPIE
jgi:ABC-type ATPase with predicted acetyltransferase domain